MISMEILADSRITQQFQITIPKRVREILKLDAGDLVLFVTDEDGINVMKGEIKIKR